ncbi:uncharacterized protein N7500_007720 [Penicillium coprophilum]|uniref:uncharacterized protein n=1 Tax=Penicillium coprophilum TaxID=36646 RepID=UPI0023878A5A|nr:uncharacterized protein N7500_007720 [Penicillium coprophilum]KAJ5158069.1 hypothetical protein N7500_007720 [Penicillium coprophilum]
MSVPSEFPEIYTIPVSSPLFTAGFSPSVVLVDPPDTEGLIEALCDVRSPVDRISSFHIYVKCGD